MTRAMFFLLTALFGSLAEADTAKMNAMREAFARMDQEDFFDGIEKANQCIQFRDFACAEKQLAEIRELANSAADERLLALATSNLQMEKQQAAEDARRQREAEEQRRRQIAAEEAAEEREARRRRIEREEEGARVIGAAILGAGQAVGQAYTDIAASNARTQEMMNEYHESVARERQQAEAARADKARREREERIAQQNYDRNRAAASAQLAAALRESREQSEREAGIRAYQQAQANTAAARTSSALLTGGVTVTAPGTGNAAARSTGSAATGYTSSGASTSSASGSSTSSKSASSNSASASSASASSAAPAATTKAKTDSADYVASPEGVVICELKTGGKFSCTSTLGTTIYGGPNETEGWRTPAEATAHVGGCRTPRRITWRSGYEVFGCGTGITGMSNYIDVAAKLGVTVPGRNTYWCKPLEIGCTRTTRP